MFLEYSVSPTDFFHSDHFSLKCCDRPFEYFFQDMQRTMDEPNLENMQIFLLSAYSLIYATPDVPIGEKSSLLASNAISLYDNYLKKAAFLFNCIYTLTRAEKQQKAFERQCIINSPKQWLHYLPGNPPQDFFEEIYTLKKSHNFYTPLESPSICIDSYKELYNMCDAQPIAAALLPALLTIYSTDGKAFKNIYSYLKYKNRRLSKQSKANILSLFNGICNAIKKYFNQAEFFFVPVFEWSEIESRFCQHMELNEADFNIAKQYFAKYRLQNDLSKAEEATLAKLPYGKQLRSLAKLCNLNVYLTMNHHNDPNSCFETITIPSKAKRPYNSLLAGELMPSFSSHYKSENFNKYFGDLYETLPSYSVFSHLALLRYYHLPFDSTSYYGPTLFDQLEESFVSITSKYVTKLLDRYRNRPQVFETKQGEEYIEHNEREIARLSYQLSTIPLRQEYIKHTKTLSSQITDKFTRQDYRDFILDISNFDVSGFPAYLKNFCNKYSISVYLLASPKEACYLEDDAYQTILTLVQNHLLENFFSFWQNAITKELYI